MCNTATAQARSTSIRYGESGSRDWLWTGAPCSWQSRVDLQFTTVPLGQLEPAGSWTHPAVVSKWLARMRAGRTVPPPVVCETDHGTLYVHDGNHRYEAMRSLFAGDIEAPVRVARLVPRPGYQFRHRRFGTYGTYALEPLWETSGINRRARRCVHSRAPLGRTLVLVAHPDDETGGCAGLLQRLQDPTVLFATDGAPLDPYFWRGHGSPKNYARVRRQEAAAALAAAGVRQFEFLGNYLGQNTFRDQQLYHAVSELFDVVEGMVRRYEPEAVLVPSYEGGHPDHDVCSFIGATIRARLKLPVWEMPLYHRSEKGQLVCQRFLELNGTELELSLSPVEARTRDAMVACYRSQYDLADYVVEAVESIRPQPCYDYLRPPHPGIVNYEAWQWPISATQVCERFREYLHSPRASQYSSFAEAMGQLTTEGSNG